MKNVIHIPVLKKEVLEYLEPKVNENFIDCTTGEGGHAKAILESNKPKGKVLGIEIDSALYQKLKSENLKRLILANDSFTNLKKIVEKEKFRKISGILFDLGMSSWHLEKSGRGFSFQKSEALDMRYSVPHFLRPWKSQDELTAEKVVNEFSEKEIEKILKEYGEERFAKRITRKIVKKRKEQPIKTTFQLVRIIKEAVPIPYQRGKIHFATRTFQALRIVVNDELNNLEKALPQAIEVLEPKGRVVVISFHSLEDRIVKNFFRNQSKRGQLKILTKKPIRPQKEEIKTNPRSRSAKLRAAVKP